MDTIVYDQAFHTGVGMMIMYEYTEMNIETLP